MNIKRRLGVFLANPTQAVCSGWDLIMGRGLGRLQLACLTGVRIEGSLHLRGRPLIELVQDATIILGDNVLLNSRNRGYHLNLYAPVKLAADRAGARITIGTRTRIHGSCIRASESVTIGCHCLIAGNCQIMDASGHALSFPDVDNRIMTSEAPRPVVIEDSVWLCAHCIVLPGVRIGRGSVIAAGSVVAKDIPPFVVAGGNPAKVIRDHSDSSSGELPEGAV